MHQKGICHRDLKPENIMLLDGTVKIADFGSCKELGKINTPYVVSRYYWAPELFFGLSDYQKNIDVWSMAVIFYEFLILKLPFRTKEKDEGS